MMNEPLRRMAVWGCLLAAVCVSAASNLAAAQPAAGTVDRIRVATFNVYNMGLNARETPEGDRFRYEVNERCAWLRQWIVQQKLDVVCLNETGALPLARYLAAGTSLRYYQFDTSRRVYVQPYRTERGVLARGYPVTILSRFPITERSVVKGADGREMIVARIQLSEKESLWVCAFHAGPSKSAKAAASYAPTWVKLKGEKAIVCGDFNTFAGSFNVEPLKQLPANGYVDVWQAKHAADDNGGTYGNQANASAAPGARIDFIWASASLASKAVSAARVWPIMVNSRRVWLSDHCPVVAEFAVEATPPPLAPLPVGPTAPAPAAGDAGSDSGTEAPVLSTGPANLPMDFEKDGLSSSLICTRGAIEVEDEAADAPQGNKALSWMPNAGEISSLKIPLKPGSLKGAQWLTFELVSRQAMPLAAQLTVTAPANGGQDGTWSATFAVRPGRQKIRLPLTSLADRTRGLLRTDGAVELEIALPAMPAVTPFLLDDMQAAADPVPGEAGQPGLFLDFGSDTDIWPGAKGVTYSSKPRPGSPVKWQTEARLENTNLGTPEPLTADFVGVHSSYPAAPIAAKISLPAGRYIAVLWLAPVSRYDTISTEMECRINGQRVVRQTLSSRQYLSEQGAWCGAKAAQAGEFNAWADLYQQTFKPYEGSISSNGTVTIEFAGCGLAAAAFVPNDQRRELAAWLERIEEARKTYFEQWVFCPRPWVSGPAPEHEKGPLAEADLAAWQASISEGLFGRLDPAGPQAREGLALTAAAGQRATVLLALHGEACERSLSVRPNAVWQAPAGTRGRPDATVERLLCFPVREQGPIHLLRPWAPGTEGQASGPDPKWRVYQVKVQVPQDASAGQYESSLRVLAAQVGKTLDLPLRVTVLPVQLAGTDGVDLGFTFDAQAMSAYAPMLTNTSLPRSLVEQTHRLMADAGFNTTNGWARVALSGNRIRFDTSDNDDKLIYNAIRQAGLARKHSVWVTASGLPGWLSRSGFKPGTEPYREASRQLLEVTHDFWARLDATPVYVGRYYYHYTDPQDTGKALEDIRAVNALAHGNAQFAAFFLSAPETKILNELLSPAAVACVYNLSRNEPAAAAAKAAHKKIWIYDAGDSRYSYGFQLHRVGAVGRWGMSAGKWLRPFDPLWPGQGGMIRYGPDGVTPLLQAEKVAEGAIDLRYALTLTRQIAAAKARGVATADAEATLQTLAWAMGQLVKDDLSGSPLDNVEGWGQMDQWRSRVAEAIADLNEKMKK